jgi:hypothetical protein
VWGCSMPKGLVPAMCVRRKVVWVLSQVDEWYTTEVVGPAVAPWAKSMGWAVGGEGGSFSLEVGGVCDETCHRKLQSLGPN